MDYFFPDTPYAKMEDVMWNPLSMIRRPARSLLGIDIGTSSVKVAEIAGSAKEATLLSYGELRSYGYLTRLREPLQSSALTMLESDVAEMIRNILEVSGARSRRASVGIPLFSSFFTTLELPPMTQQELQEAIPYQAQQIVPIPVSEVILDWEIIGRIGGTQGGGGQPREKLLVLLVAVPREVVDRYVRIAKLAAVELEALEVEAFSLVRAAFRGDQRTLALLDIGARSTNMLVAEEGTVRLSRSIDASGSELTSAVARSLGIGMGRAEAMKIAYGIGDAASPDIRRLLTGVLETIVGELGKLVATYRRNYGKSVEALVLTGGSSTLPGLTTYLSERLSLPVSLAAPFRGLHYPQELEPVLEEIGPSFTVAVGLALRHAIPSAVTPQLSS